MPKVLLLGDSIRIRWIGELGQPDIVHWNNGLHDCGHNPARNPVQIPVDMYRENLKFILNRLRGLTLNVLWATLTPVHPDRPFRESQWSWRNEEIDRYNAAARELMEAHEVPITELHELVWGDVEGFLSEDQLHLSQTGQMACASAVAQAISADLA